MADSEPKLEDFLQAVQDAGANPEARALASEMTKEQTAGLLDTIKDDLRKVD